MKKSGFTLIKILSFAIAFLIGPVSISYAQHSDIWLTLTDNQVTPTEINTETNDPALVDLTTGKFLYSTTFGTPSNPEIPMTGNPGFRASANTFDPGFMYYRVVGSLWFWNGQAWVNNVVDQERFKIEDVLGDKSFITPDGVIDGVITDEVDGVITYEVSSPVGAIDQIGGSGSIHQHIKFDIENNLGSANPATGAYMIDIELFVTNSPGGSLETHLSSEPIRIAFNYMMSQTEFSDAINALTSPVDPEPVSVPMSNGALFLLASLLLLFGSFEKRRKFIVR